MTCDNVARCEASLVRPANTPAANPHDVLLSREPGPSGAMEIVFTAEDRIDGIIDLLIDGRLVGTGMYEKGAIRLKGAAAEGLARAMVNGRRLSLRFGRRVFATVSLAGSSAMLRYIDAEQGRAGGVTAIAARGTKPASAVPAAKPLPRVPAIRPPAGSVAPPKGPALDNLRARPGCEATRPEHVEEEAYRLDRKTALALIPCRPLANDFSYRIFVERDGSFAPAQFDWPPEDAAGKPLGGDVPEIVLPAWRNGQLETRLAGSNFGDCGIIQTWAWDGERFRMTRIQRLRLCGRWAMWLTAWRAEPVWR